MRRAGTDASALRLPGPWTHRGVSANGIRLQVAECDGGGPLVVLLHGFPEFWWSWRHQLPALAERGYRVVAVDLRGYGGSDKPPRGYDPFTLARDVAGVVKALGERRAVLVGHGWGGYVGWATAVLHPREVTALCAVSAPHPLQMLRSLRVGGSTAALAHLLAAQPPLLPERRLSDPAGGFLRAHLTGWSGPGASFPDEEALARYQAALRLWPAPHCALEYHRWLLRSRLRADGRRFNRLMGSPVHRPVCTIVGDADPVLPRAAEVPPRLVAGGLRSHRMPGVGHFPAEEDPAGFDTLLLAWLADLSG